jgi:DNA polymerase sigma
MAIPIYFSVNNTTPLYNMALLTECGQMDSRAKSLILFVRRWAKDRGVCHASKGHLPPYAWSLFVIYYLQVGVQGGDGNLPLPALEAFAVSSGLMKADEHSAQPPKSNGGAESPKSKPSTGRPLALAHPQQKSIGELFKGFVRFYRHFDWRKEAICVRSGKRAAPNLALDIHIVIHDDGQTAVSPIVEDPFDAKRNLGNCTNSASLRRFLEEFERADDLLSNGTSLTKILEPWRPPEHTGEKHEGEQDEDFENDM